MPAAIHHPYVLENLESRLRAHTLTFDSLLKTIPAKFYVIDEKTDEQNEKYQHNKRKKAPKQEVKEAHRKAKIAKLDPENNKTVAEIQSEKLTDAKRRAAEKADIDEESIEGATPADAEDTYHNLDNSTSQAVKPLPTGASIAVLRQKLHERIWKFRNQRSAPGCGKPGAPESREEILEGRLKRKADRKEQLKKMKDKKGKGGSKAADDAELIVKNPDAIKPSNPSTRDVDGINDQADVVFSKFAFDGEKKRKRGPDAHAALKKAEAKVEKLNKLAETDAGKAKKIAEDDTWKKAVQLAAGEKPKDDIKLLKKTIKRQDQEKKKSAKEWREREDTVEASISSKQKKREENIQARIDLKKSGKAGKAAAKKAGKKVGPAKKHSKRNRAGFEGKVK